jgi:hypothetical protein
MAVGTTHCQTEELVVYMAQIAVHVASDTFESSSYGHAKYAPSRCIDNVRRRGLTCVIQNVLWAKDQASPCKIRAAQALRCVRCRICRRAFPKGAAKSRGLGIWINLAAILELRNRDPLPFRSNLSKSPACFSEELGGFPPSGR